MKKFRTIIHIIVVALLVGLYMAFEYSQRGYFALGAEIMLPLLYIGYRLVICDDKRA